MNANHRGIGMTSQRARDHLCQQLQEMGIHSEPVLDAIRNTPRHIFVDEALASRAYENTALPIGQGQTISQPYMVARMTESLLESGSLDKVLEVGTGCGYQTAILAHFCVQVYSIERISALLEKARARLRDLQLRNIRIKYGDGFKGWLEVAPFDAILVAAAPAGLPEPLLQQLKIGGRMVIPVGDPGNQQLMLITRHEDRFAEELLDYVSFVPLLGGRA